MSQPIAARLSAIRQAMVLEGFDAVVLNPGPSLPYLSGLHFHISERPVLFCITADDATIVVPELEAQKLNHASFPLRSFTYTENLASWQVAFDSALAHLNTSGGKKVGIEPISLRVLELRFLEAALPQAKLTSCEQLIARLRMRKDEQELRLMRDAVEMAQLALADTLPHVKVGVSELEISSILIQRLLAHGSGGELPFQPIIAFGANSANPHAVPSDYTAKEGDLILFDWGANNQGYFSDLTRTFSLGEPGETLRNVHDAVNRANAAGRAQAGPGITTGSIDDATRGVIQEAGYGEYFTHRTGHGLGLEVHEEPYIRSGNDSILDIGMTFTIEPGIYLPDQGGVRIEDDMVITESGAESLSTYPRELRILPV